MNQLLIQKNYKHILANDFILKQCYKNIMEIPKIIKIVINSSSKQTVNDKKQIIPTLLAIEIISGQNLQLTRAKKSIATFKLRKNQFIGGKVTLRNNKKNFFFDKFIKIILPRLNEFHGINFVSFDKQANLNFGIKNVLIFPELENYFQFFDNITGINVNIQVSKGNLKEFELFFTLYQIPINDHVYKIV